MKSTLKLPAPGTIPAVVAPSQETYEDKLATETIQTERKHDDLETELARLRKDNDNLQSELQLARGNETAAKSKLERELTAHKTEVATLKAQLEAASSGAGAESSVLLYVLVALIMVLLGVIGSLMTGGSGAVGNVEHAD